LTFLLFVLQADAAPPAAAGAAAAFFPLAGAFLAAFGLAAAFGFFGLFAFFGEAADFGLAAFVFFGEAAFLAAGFLAAFGFDGAVPAADGLAVAATAATFGFFLAGYFFGFFVFSALAFGFLGDFGFGDPAAFFVTAFLAFFTTGFPPSVGFLSPKRKLPDAPLPFACLKTPVVTPRFNAVFKWALTIFRSFPTLKFAMMYFKSA